MSTEAPVVSVSKLGKRYLVPQKAVGDKAYSPSVRQRSKEFFPTLFGAAETDYFWALRDVSFELRRGEVLGILGENGSGKSTLLKILSGITPPSAGSAQMRGRIGSLLEVGTGFHPDLTGRENVFLNGGLLGIPRFQIEEALSGIIKFAELEEFIDVPVKRYSSGMYVRLAFSVAALLKPDILILDEVLAVGDARFRAKTQSKISEATDSGQTILFVSHNARSVAQICTRAIILHKGQMVFDGAPVDAIDEYNSRSYVDDETGQLRDASEISQHSRERLEPSSSAELKNKARTESPGQTPTPILEHVSLHKLNGEPSAKFATGEGMLVRIKFSHHPHPEHAYFSVLVHNSLQDRMITAHSTHSGERLPIGGSGWVECVIPSMLVGDGLYSVMLDTGTYNTQLGQMISLDCVTVACHIRVRTGDYLKGVGLDEFRGAAHRSNWSVATPDRTA